MKMICKLLIELAVLLIITIQTTAIRFLMFIRRWALSGLRLINIKNGHIVTMHIANSYLLELERMYKDLGC